MKKNIIIMISLLLTPVITAIIFRSLDTPVKPEKQISSPKISRMVTQRPNGEGWVDARQELRTYNKNAFPKTEIFQVMKEGKWVNTQRMEHSYEANSNLELVKVWSNWKEEKWIPAMRFSFEYDAQNRPIKELIEEFKNNAWVQSRKVETKFSEGSQKSQQVYYNQIDESWTQSWKDEFEYNDDLLMQKIGHRWSDEVWLPSMKVLYAYQDRTRISETSYRFISEEFSEWRKITFSYELGDRIVSTHAQIKKDGTWIDQERQNYFYHK